MEEISVDSKISKKELFRFLMYHNYWRLIGILGLLFSVSCLTGAVLTFGRVKIGSTVLLLLLGALFTVYQPLMLYRKAVVQSRHPVFAKAAHYVMDDSGITVSQDGDSAAITWEEMWKVVGRKREIYLFVDPVRANIISRSQAGEKAGTIMEMARRYMGPSQVKGK